jgi:glutamate synthase (NADPH/NADH) small chain
MDYLRQQNHRVAGDSIDPVSSIDAGEGRVVVIGGGDTGGDCIGTAIRQGARKVTQIQYHECPPPDPDRLSYWPQPVPGSRLSDHDAEGCTHLWCCDTVAFEGHGGQVRRVRLQPLCWEPAGDGRLRKRPAAAPQRGIAADLVLLAMGYAHVRHDGLLQELAPALDNRGNVVASDHRTSIDGVFACGDCHRGQSLVVWAIREGRRCARAVDIHLSGDSVLPEV